MSPALSTPWSRGLGLAMPGLPWRAYCTSLVSTAWETRILVLKPTAKLGAPIRPPLQVAFDLSSLISHLENGPSTVCPECFSGPEKAVKQVLAKF